MFDRFVLASNYERIRKKFNITSLPDGQNYVPSCNIAPNDNSWVIILEQPLNPEAIAGPPDVQAALSERRQAQVIRSFKFGLEGIEKGTKYFIRSEGERNLQNDPHYSGSKAIFLNNKYKRIIRGQRCLVLADAFIINLDKKPYLVYLRDHQRPFVMAGIYNETQDKNGIKSYSFGILTTVSNPLIRKLGNDRMPVIIPENRVKSWLSKKTPLSYVLSMLTPYPYEQMNAYEISEKIKDTANNDLSVIQPIGERLYSEKIEYIIPKRHSKLRNITGRPPIGELLRGDTEK